MVIVSKNKIAEWLLLDTFSELHVVKEKINFYSNKYGMSFQDFDRAVSDDPEEFERYDDYIEWKAYEQMLHSIETRITEIRNGNLKVS